MAKVRKPMRIDEELIVLVEEKGKGTTFTAKMEYILNDYFHTLDKKKKELELVEKQISEKRKEYNKFSDKVNKAKGKFDKVLREILWN